MGRKALVANPSHCFPHSSPVKAIPTMVASTNQASVGQEDPSIVQRPCPECDDIDNDESSGWKTEPELSTVQTSVSSVSNVGPVEHSFTTSSGVPSIITAALKHVRFAVDERGRVEKQIFEFERIPESCLPELYYSEDEISEIQIRCRNEAREYIKNHKYYRQCLKRVLDTKKAGKQDAVVKLLVEASEVRGLETLMTKMLKAQRRLAVLSVLDLQHQIRNMGVSQTKFQRQTMLEMGLRAKSSQESRPFQTMALCLAEADAKSLK